MSNEDDSGLPNLEEDLELDFEDMDDALDNFDDPPGEDEPSGALNDSTAELNDDVGLDELDKELGELDEMEDFEKKDRTSGEATEEKEMSGAPVEDEYDGGFLEDDAHPTDFVEVEFPVLPQSRNSMTQEELRKQHPLNSPPRRGRKSLASRKKAKPSRPSRRNTRTSPVKKRRSRTSGQPSGRSTKSSSRSTKSGKKRAKSALMRSRAPRFSDASTIESRKQKAQERVQKAMQRSAKMSVYRLMQRRLLKEDYELSREQRLAEQKIQKKRKIKQWKRRMKNSPFQVNLVADTERIEEERRVKRLLEKRKKRAEKQRLEKLKNHLIINALLEVPSTSELTRHQRRMIEGEERQMRAQYDVHRSQQGIMNRSLMTERQKLEVDRTRQLREFHESLGWEGEEGQEPSP